jgi:pimeloyl-ACP methyl ester carboxylesterase
VEPLVVTTREGEIHGRRFDGDGHPAVLLHGGPGMSASYLDSLVPFLTGVFSPILYQQRGSCRRPSASPSRSRRTSPTPRR